jgi:glycosyltransferase involved in cell wall biosynthesis
VVISDFHVTDAVLKRRLSGVPGLMLLPSRPEPAAAGVAWHCFRPATNPLWWEPAVDDAIRRSVDTAAFFMNPGDVRGRTLLRLRELGIRRVLFPGRGRFRITSPLFLALCRRLAALGRRAAGLTADLSGRPTTLAQCREVLRYAAPRRQCMRGGRLRIAHFVTSLNSGGAPRQACIAAAQQKRHGHDVRVWTRLAVVGEDAHYRYLLEPYGLEAQLIGSRWSDRFPDAWRRVGLRRAPFRGMPPDLAGQVIDLVGELLTEPVDVLHCYVDDCNVPGVIAACLTGTPAVVLSFRNGNPEKFRGLLRPWMRAWYRATRGRLGVRFTANSERGARDYERWLELPGRSVPVIRNAFVPPPLPVGKDVDAWRRSVGIPKGAPVVAGVFRLQPEKRPLYFLECIRRLAPAVPGLRVVVAGVGDLAGRVGERVAELGLSDTVLLLGQRRDVPTLLAGSDVTLLVSEWEGTPNVLLEAQHCGCVPVATDAGGTRETIEPGETGLLVGMNDVDETVGAVKALLADPGRRRCMAERGRARVTREFAPDALYAANDRLYNEALGDRDEAS